MSLLLEELLNIETVDLYSTPVEDLLSYKNILDSIVENFGDEQSGDKMREIEEALDLLDTELQARGEL